MARDFDGVDDRIVCGTTGIPTTGDSTTIAVVKMDVFEFHDCVFNRSSGTANGWRAGLDAGTANMRFTKQGVLDITSALVLTDGVWYALAWKADVSTDVKFFRKQITGTLSTETVADTNAITAPTGGNSIIGNRVGDEVTAWNGPIAYVAVYDKLLADNVIESILNGADPFIAAPVGYWHLFGLSTEQDWSGNNNHGTVTGTTVVDHPPGISAIWLAPHPRLVQVAAAAAAGADGGGPRTFAAFVPGFP